MLLPPTMKLRQGNIFTSVCQEFCPQGGHAWQRGVCMVGGHAWQGDVCGRGECVGGSMHGRGHVWQGACMVGRWHTWQGVHNRGSMHGRGACMAGKMAMGAGGMHPT